MAEFVQREIEGKPEMARGRQTYRPTARLIDPIYRCKNGQIEIDTYIE